MFIIAGVTPKTTILDDTPRLCPVCGLAQAKYQRIDHYFSLFFIPLFRVKTGQPFLMCNRCERPVDPVERERTAPEAKSLPPKLCRDCGRALETDFKFCPYCGKRN